MAKSAAEAVLPLLMAEGMLSEGFVSVFNLDGLNQKRDGTFIVPPGFAKTARRQRPHLFSSKSTRYVDLDKLQNLIFTYRD